MRRILSIAAVLLLAAPASADTIVLTGGKPGVATAWKTDGDAVVLTIKDGFSASEVAAAIARAVPGAKATSDAAMVRVTGLTEKALVAALERVEVDEELDDIDSAFAAMATAGGDDEGSGSSIRATSAATIPSPDAARSIVGKVVSIRHKRFPLVLVTLKTDTGETITVVPRIAARGGVIVSDDKQSQANVSAWYARPGDRVKVDVAEKKNNVWIAQTFARVR